MTRKTWHINGGALVGVALLAGAFAVYAQPQGPPVDRGKGDIERSTKQIVGPVTPPPPALDLKDFAKGKAERPTEDILARTAKAEADKGFANPKVAPGKVTWHKDFAAACEASKKSGKPVLLFQMMGKLDDKFC